MTALIHWAGQLGSLGSCQTCRGSGSVTHGQWGARPPQRQCGRCGGTGVDPAGPLQGLVPERNGLLIRRTDGWDVYVVRMLVNHRVVLSRTGDRINIVAAFCYRGTDDVAMMQAILSAKEWAAGDVLETNPLGYLKVAFDGRDHAYWAVQG